MDIRSIKITELEEVHVDFPVEIAEQEANSSRLMLNHQLTGNCPHLRGKEWNWNLSWNWLRKSTKREGKLHLPVMDLCHYLLTNSDIVNRPRSDYRVVQATAVGPRRIRHHSS